MKGKMNLLENASNQCPQWQRAVPGSAGVSPAASERSVARTPREDCASSSACSLTWRLRPLALRKRQAGRLRSQGCALLTALLLLLTSAYAQDAQLLAPGKAIEATITGGQTHTYRLTLQAGQFVHFDVQQTSCDVALTVMDPKNWTVKSWVRV